MPVFKFRKFEDLDRLEREGVYINLKHLKRLKHGKWNSGKITIIRENSFSEV